MLLLFPFDENYESILYCLCSLPCPMLLSATVSWEHLLQKLLLFHSFSQGLNWKECKFRQNPAHFQLKVKRRSRDHHLQRNPLWPAASGTLLVVSSRVVAPAFTRVASHLPLDNWGSSSSSLWWTLAAFPEASLTTSLICMELCLTTYSK